MMKNLLWGIRVFRPKGFNRLYDFIDFSLGEGLCLADNAI